MWRELSHDKHFLNATRSLQTEYINHRICHESNWNQNKWNLVTKNGVEEFQGD